MTGLDTNVVVRFFVQDDRVQFKRAGSLLTSFTAESPGFITGVCLAEVVWVLRSQYQASKQVVLSLLERLVDASELVLENEDSVREAVGQFRSGKADFSDFLIAAVARSAGCDETVTFDKNAARFVGMRLL